MTKRQLSGILKVAIGISLYMIGDKLNKLGIVDWSTVFVCGTGLVTALYGVVEIFTKDTRK